MKNFMRNFNKETIVKDILDILSIKSFTDDPIGIAKCQQFVTLLATQMGFDVSICGKGKVIVVSPKNLTGILELGIVVHLDTVPFNETDWKYNPLGEISNGRIYGRGVLDDKAAIILTLHTFKHLESYITNSWQIIIGSSEEGTWTDMQYFLEENPILPRFMVTVDGDGIQNGCRGCLNLVLNFKKSSDTYNLEQLYIPCGVQNIVPDKAIAIVNGQKFCATGFSVHSSFPEKGENAFMNLMKQLSDNFNVTSEFPNFFEFMEILQKDNCAKLLGFAPDTSICLTQCNLTLDTISINLNIRLGPVTTKDGLFEALSRIVIDYNCSKKISSLIFPSYVREDSKEIQLMCQAYEKVIGHPTTPNIARGLGYNATLPNCAIFGPRFALEDDEPDTCHGIDENRKIEDLMKFQEILAIFIYELLKK